MERWLRRIFWISGLVLGGVGTLVFMLVCIREGLPSRDKELILWVWPVLTISIAIISARGLRRTWQEESFVGKLHLTIHDMLACSFLAGLFPILWKVLLPTGAPLMLGLAMLIVTAGMMCGVLAAARIGMAKRQSYVYAVFFTARLFGCVLMMLLILIVAGQLMRLEDDIEYLVRWIIGRNPDDKVGFVWLLSAFVLSLGGHAALWLIHRGQASGGAATDLKEHS